MYFSVIVTQGSAWRGQMLQQCDSSVSSSPALFLPLSLALGSVIVMSSAFLFCQRLFDCLNRHPLSLIFIKNLILRYCKYLKIHLFWCQIFEQRKQMCKILLTGNNEIYEQSFCLFCCFTFAFNFPGRQYVHTARKCGKTWYSTSCPCSALISLPSCRLWCWILGELFCARVQQPWFRFLQCRTSPVFSCYIEGEFLMSCHITVFKTELSYLLFSHIILDCMKQIYPVLLIGCFLLFVNFCYYEHTAVKSFVHTLFHIAPVLS